MTQGSNGAHASNNAGTAQLSVSSASVNLTKNLVGAGIFSLPIALLRGSAVLGVATILLVGVLCGSSFVLIAYLCRELRTTTYRGIWCAAFGGRSGPLVDICILANGFFACVSYIILIVDFLQKSLDGLLGWEQAPRALIVWVTTFFFLLPLSHARDLSPLKYTSVAGLLIIALVFVYVVSDFCGNFSGCAATLKTHAVHLDWGIFSTVAISTGAFKAHYNAPRFFAELNSDLRAHSRVVVQSFLAAFSIYATFALAGLGLFGDEVLGNLLKNYGAHASIAILLAWLGMAFSIICTYPLVFTSARESFIGMVPALQRATKTNPTGAHIGITTGLVLLISLVSLQVEDVSIVTGVLGATIGSCLCWIFPASIYLKVALGAGGKRPSGLQAPLLPGHAPAPRRIQPNAALSGYCIAIILVGMASMCIGLCVVTGIL